MKTSVVQNVNKQELVEVPVSHLETCRPYLAKSVSSPYVYHLIVRVYDDILFFWEDGTLCRSRVNTVQCHKFYEVPDYFSFTFKVNC